MKKILLLLLFATSLCFSASAAYQYGANLLFSQANNVYFTMEKNPAGRDIGKFGMYSISSSGQMAVLSLAYSIPNQEFVFRDAAGDKTVVDAGSTIGFWLEADGQVYTSPAIVAGSKEGDFQVGFGSGEFGGGNSMWDDAEFVFNVTAPGAKVSGQPLPGVIATLVLAGGGLAAMRRRRNRA